jgi:Ras-related protein Rab-8A
MTTNFDMQIKLLMIGDSGVGKTCLLLRYSNDSFSPTFITTIGIDFKIKTVQLDGKTVKLQIWDTAGQERFRTITTSYFRGAQGILLVYDVTDRNSFENIKNWVGQINVHAENSINISKVLIGNKSDVDESERQVTREQGEQLAKEFNIEHFFEASAKQDKNVKDAFEAVAKSVMTRLTQDGFAQPARKNDGGKGIVIPDNQKPTSNGCACGK